MKIFFSAIFIFSAIKHYSSSCDCIMYPLKYYVKQVDVIFTGKVVELLDTMYTEKLTYNTIDKEFFKDKSYQVKVLVLERLKADIIHEDTLEFISDFTNCDPLYKLGESYFFFADKTKDEKFKMTHCTYWGTVSESRYYIRELKKILKK